MMKKLYRSTKDKKLVGVCSGLASYFNLDPAIIRIIFLLTALVWGVSVVIYIVCWICMPEENSIR
ncbi:PspC domain-containing protein [bacterium]|nr:PspC domain-containing protein [bacterium]